MLVVLLTVGCSDIKSRRGEGGSEGRGEGMLYISRKSSLVMVGSEAWHR